MPNFASTEPMPRIYVAILLLWIPFLLMGQQKNVVLMGAPEEVAIMQKYSKHKEAYTEQYLLEKDLQKTLLSLYNQGYLTASVDTIEALHDKFQVWLFLGEQYEWVKLHPGNVEEPVLNQTGYKEKLYTNTRLNYTEFDRFMKKVVTYYENNGFPFARIQLDSVYIEGNSIEATLRVQKNQLMVYDTLALYGNARINKKYLYNYLGIKPGDLYDEANIKQIERRLNELPFLSVERPLEILFIQDKARISLYLTDRKASQFDFLVGFLPNNQETGKILITGEANLNLVNPFGTGKEIRLNWRKLQAGTQYLNIGFSYPYLFSLPLGADLSFDLYKRDSLYLDIDYEIGLQYLFVGRNYLRAFVHNKITNALNVDTAQIRQTRSLPEYNDVRNVLYGLEYNYQNLDYIFNPRRGWHFKASAGIGTKRINRNNTIEQLTDSENPGETFAFLYDTIKTRSLQYRFTLGVINFVPIKKRSTFKFALNGGAFFSDNTFQNEQFRIGGTHLLRGFDEESIFTSLYTILTVEYRFLLSRNSYFSLFSDVAYTEDRTLNTYSNDWPYGFGAGLSFETKAGMFGVSYALGGRQDDPVSFNRAKIHFGYYNYF